MARVVVLGSINQDVVVTCERAPELGETVHGSNVAYFPGGKGANQAVAAARYGADVAFVGAVGGEPAGQAMLANLDAEGVDRSRVRVTDTPTGTASIVVDAAGSNAIVVVPGANAELGEPDAALIGDFEPGDVLVCQLEIPRRTVSEGLATAKARGLTTILNAAPAADVRDLLANADVLVVNETEIRLNVGESLSDEPKREELRTLAARFADEHDVGVVITLGGEGCLACRDGEIVDLPAARVEVVDTTGAGDTFVGTLAARLASGSSFANAVATAAAAGSLATTKLGAQSGMPTGDEVSAFENRRG